MKLFGNRHGGFDPGEDRLQESMDDSLLPEDTECSPQTDDEEFYDEYDPSCEDFDPEWDDPSGEPFEEAYREEEEYRDEDDPEGDENPRSKGLLWKSALISFGACLVVFIIAAALAVNYFLDMINYQSADSDFFATVAPSELEEEETYEDSYLAALDEADTADDLEASPEDLERWNDHIDKITSDSSTFEIPISQDVYNILLIGTDNRSSGETGRSDVMMLVSINQKTETIYLTSFLRDCYVSIPGYGKTRMNHAFAYGGPDKLMETLESNFKVHVDRYAMVDFYSFMDVIDVLGGVWIYMTDEEIRVANKYIWSMNKLMDEEWSEDYIWGEEGWRKLNGKQSLAHARNRFTGSDYERTARQRNIINQIINGAMMAEPSALVDLAQVVLPQITTDMTKAEILTYVANIGAYLSYDIQQVQVPVEGSYYGATISGMSVISLDLEDNIRHLQSTIYAGTEYADSAGNE